MTLAVIAHGDKNQIDKQLVTLAGFIEGNDLSQKKRLVILSDSDDEILAVPPGINEIVVIPLRNSNRMDSILSALGDYFKDHPHSLLLFASDDRSRQLAVRLAYRLAGSSSLGVRAFKMSLEAAEVVKGIYSNNASGRIKLEKGPYCIAVEKTFKGSLVSNSQAVLRYPLVAEELSQIDYRREAKNLQDRLEDENQVIIIGNGIEKKDLASIEDLAKKMGAGLGGTRSAVERGLVSIDKLVGISGKIIAPKLCLLIGVSGMAALTGGIEGSEKVIAINNNPEAPIFKFAHYGIVKAYQEIVPQLLASYNDEEKKSG